MRLWGHDRRRRKRWYLFAGIGSRHLYSKYIDFGSKSDYLSSANIYHRFTGQEESGGPETDTAGAGSVYNYRFEQIFNYNNRRKL